MSLSYNTHPKILGSIEGVETRSCWVTHHRLDWSSDTSPCLLPVNSDHISRCRSVKVQSERVYEGTKYKT